MIVLKGASMESLLVARTHIHNKMIEKTKEDEELWISDLVKQQKQLDLFIGELGEMTDSECDSSRQLKERIGIIEKILQVNEALAKLFM